MTSLTIKIECLDLDSANNMKRAFKKNSVGYDTTVLLEEHKYYIVIVLNGDLP